MTNSSQVSLYLGLATATATFAAAAVALGLLECAKLRDRALSVVVLLCATLGISAGLATVAAGRTAGTRNALIALGIVATALFVIARALRSIFTPLDSADGVLYRQMYVATAGFLVTLVSAGIVAVPDIFAGFFRSRSLTQTPPVQIDILRDGVTKWYAGPGARHQVQVKLAMAVTNSSGRPLDISLRHIRLIVTHLDPAAWSPSRLGAASPGTPFETSYFGKRVWTIPANGEGAFDFLSSNLATFATRWNTAHLGPHATFAPVDHQRGVVVFNVPTAAGAAELGGIVGVAFMSGRQVVAIYPPERWGPRVDGPSF